MFSGQFPSTRPPPTPNSVLINNVRYLISNTQEEDPEQILHTLRMLARFGCAKSPPAHVRPFRFNVQTYGEQTLYHIRSARSIAAAAAATNYLSVGCYIGNGLIRSTRTDTRAAQC